MHSYSSGWKIINSKKRKKEHRMFVDNGFLINWAGRFAVEWRATSRSPKRTVSFSKTKFIVPAWPRKKEQHKSRAELLRYVYSNLGDADRARPLQHHYTRDLSSRIFRERRYFCLFKVLYRTRLSENFATVTIRIKKKKKYQTIFNTR